MPMTRDATPPPELADGPRKRKLSERAKQAAESHPPKKAKDGSGTLPAALAMNRASTSQNTLGQSFQNINGP